MTGLTLPGMIDEPFCSSGRKISPMPARGPEPISARSLAILVSETATTFSAPDSSTSASRLAWASNGSAGASIFSLVCLVSSRCAPRSANFGWVFRPVPVAVPPSGIWRRATSAASTRSWPEAHLRRVAAELLAERHRHGVHEVRAAGLDDVRRTSRPCARTTRSSCSSAGSSWFVAAVQRGEVHGAREHVVGGLAHVDVVVGVRALAGERGDDLVGVHVRARCPSRSGRRRSGTGRRARRRRPRRRPRRSRSARSVSSSPSSALTRAAGALDAAQPVDDRRGDRLAGDREVLDGLGGLAAPQLVFFSVGAHAASAYDALVSRRTPPARARRRPGRRRRSGSRCRAARAAAPSGSRSSASSAAASGCRRSSSAHSSSTGSRCAGRRRAARAAAPRGQRWAKRAHERARLALPPTSAKAWRTRSRAAGLPRARQPQPASGRTASVRGVRQRAVERRARAPARAAVPPGARGPGCSARRCRRVGHQHEPRGAQQAASATARSSDLARRARGRRRAGAGRAPRGRTPAITSANQSSV